MIANPLAGEGFAAWFRTHPPTSARVRRLRRLAAELDRWRPVRAPARPLQWSP